MLRVARFFKMGKIEPLKQNLQCQLIDWISLNTMKKSNDRATEFQHIPDGLKVFLSETTEKKERN